MSAGAPHPHRASGASKEAGFTLLEVLIAVTLLGFLTVLAYGGVRFGSLSWAHAERSSGADADQAAIARCLRQALASAQPTYTSADPTDRTVTFTGTADELTLVSVLPDAIEPGVSAVQRFRLAEGGLVLEWHADLPAADGGALPFTSVRLGDGIVQIRFSYFGRVQPAAASWFDAWAGLPALPELVRVRIWRRSADAPWLDLVTATKITTNTECVYDPSDLNCRRTR